MVPDDITKRRSVTEPEERRTDGGSLHHSVGHFRTAQATLVDDRPSLASVPPTAKDRVLLTVLSGPGEGTVACMTKPAVTLGRSHDADIVIPDPSLSRVHARIRSLQSAAGTRYVLEDAGSTNGTFLGRERVRQPVELRDGCRIGLGRRTFVRFALQDQLEEQAALRVHDSALRDALTGLHNRSVFDDRLRTETAFSIRHGCALTLMMIDVDHFKYFNDAHGHQAGDAALRLVATRMRAELRTEDLLARYGGEEFAVLVRGVSAERAGMVAERVRTSVASATLLWQQSALPLTVSIGVAHMSGVRRITPDTLLKRADDALYRAKELGRNQISDGGLADGPPRVS